MAEEFQRAELHQNIWQIVNNLPSNVNGWNFKSNIMVMVFYRFISESTTTYLNSYEEEGFDYARFTDEQAEVAREETVSERLFQPAFPTICQRTQAGQNAPNFNETLDGIFRNIEGSAVDTASEDDIKGLFDDLNVSSPKLDNSVTERNGKSIKLPNVIGDLPLATLMTTPLTSSVTPMNTS